MPRETTALQFSAEALSQYVKALYAAELLAHAAQTNLEPVGDGDPRMAMAQWLRLDPEKNKEYAFSCYGKIATSPWSVDERDTAHFAPLGETDWGAISVDIMRLGQADSLIPSEEIRDLARRVASRDYSRDDIKEWARRLSQLPFSDEE